MFCLPAPGVEKIKYNDTTTYFVANHPPQGHYPIRPEDVFNEEELEEIQRSGQALYRDGSKPPERTPDDPPRKPAAEEN